MNNEKQHSEYKIIETVATPTFDGVSVETHPEDQLGGGSEPPEPTPTEGDFVLVKTSHDICVACRFQFIEENSALVAAESVGDGSNEHPYKVRTRRATGDVIGIELQTSSTHNEMMQNLSSALTTYLGNFNMLLDDLIVCGDTESEMFESIEPTVAVI